MQFKIFPLFTLLFSSNIFFAEELKNIHPCLNIETMQKEIIELTKKQLKAYENLELPEILKQNLILGQKFLDLPEEKQKRKIEKYLASDYYKRIIQDFSSFHDAIKNKKIDDNNFDFLLNFKEQTKLNFKEECICHACFELLFQDERLDRKEILKELTEVKIKMLFHFIRKEEDQKFIKRQQELHELEEKACNEFNSLIDFLNYDKLHGNNVLKDLEDTSSSFDIPEKLCQNYAEYCEILIPKP